MVVLLAEILKNERFVFLCFFLLHIELKKKKNGFDYNKANKYSNQNQFLKLKSAYLMTNSFFRRFGLKFIFFLISAAPLKYN